MLMKVLLPLAAVFVCFMINPIFGLIASFAALLICLYYFLPNLYAVQGNKLFSKGDLQGAEKWYNRAVNTGRASDKLKLAYGILQLRSGKPEAAQRQLDELARKKSAKPEIKQQAKQYRCMAYCKQGRMDEAMEDAQELFEVTKNTITYGIMGYFMHLTDAPADETLKLCEEAYEYNADDRDIVDNLALAYYRAGQYEKAKEYTDKLVENNPTFVEAFYHGALVEEALGNMDKAREYLKKLPECNRTYMTTVSQEAIDTLTERLGG